MTTNYKNQNDDLEDMMIDVFGYDSTANRAAINKSATQSSKDMIGTSKQIIWANNIKSKMNIDPEIASRSNAAKFWIDSRSLSVAEITKLLLAIKTSAEKSADTRAKNKAAKESELLVKKQFIEPAADFQSIPINAFGFEIAEEFDLLKCSVHENEQMSENKKICDAMTNLGRVRGWIGKNDERYFAINAKGKRVVYYIEN